MQAYSKEFRREVLAACDAGGRTRLVATQFRCQRGVGPADQTGKSS